jgi:hypothetical protein
LASLYRFRIADLDPSLVSFRGISVRHVEEFVMVVESPHSSPFPQKRQCRRTTSSKSLLTGFADAHRETREFDRIDDKFIEDSPPHFPTCADKRHKSATAAFKSFARAKSRLVRAP